MIPSLAKIDRHQENFKNLYTKIRFHTNKDTADFTIQNVNIDEICEEFYFLYDSDRLVKSSTSNFKLLIDISPVNCKDDLNEHFRTVNSMLSYNGLFVSCVGSNNNRKKISLTNHNKFSDIVKFKWDFLRSLFTSKRKSVTSQIKSYNKTRYKSLSLAEVLGRLAYCGFEIVNYNNTGNSTYIISKKISSPQNSNPSSSRSIVKMERVGKKGKLIHIYKIRTMYPYSEFIQDYVVKQNGYNAFGKPNNDFRLIKYGKLIRKLYIDELPQFYNLLKGEINLVGVRPMSKFGFNSLPPDLQKERIKFKPGLIPPHIAMGLTGWDGVIKAERKYLEEYKKNPLKTNFKYFVFSVFNILTFRAKGN